MSDALLEIRSCRQAFPKPGGEDLLVRARVEAAIIGEGGRPKRFPKEWIAAFMPIRPVPSS